ncbi:hypothetical protein K502DRAFT_325187 [Neoconidiobolus thromboides FSU 785]|nr:hypothetical protein K502DRAFT_325187 [Neoconidiobolus thromboides FSU 785]
MCIKKDIECTLNREIIYNKKANIEYASGRKIVKTISKATSIVDCIHAKGKRNLKQPQSKEIKYQLLKLPKDYNFSHSILGIFNKFERKSLLENLLIFIQNPSPFFPSKGLNLFMILTNKLGLLASKTRRLAFIPEVPNKSTFDIGPILKQAVTNYFKFVNVECPLFDETRFDFTSRSFHLKSTIFVGGLFYMDQTETVKNLVKYFEEKLYNFVSNVPRIKPNLENIQIILILVTSFTKFEWIANIREFLLFHCYRMSFVIGLSQSSKKFFKETNAERIYTYCLLSVYYNGFILNLGSYIAEPVFPLQMNRLDNHFKSKFSHYAFDFDKDDKNIQQCCFFKLHEFYYIISTLFFDLHLIKGANIKEIEDYVKFNSVLKKLLFKILVVKETYTRVMNNILVKIKNEKSKSTIKDYQNCINYFYHHTNFYIHSIRFNASKEKKVYEYEEYMFDNNINTNVLNHIKIITKEYYLVIDSIAKTSHKYTLGLDYAILSTCLVLLIRYGGKEVETIMYIQKGKDLLEFLQKSPLSARICKFNLALIGIITESLKIL